MSPVRVCTLPELVGANKSGGNRAIGAECGPHTYEHVIKRGFIVGLTLVEILIGIVVSSLMMAAMYSTYSIVNNSYSQVVQNRR